MKLFGLNFYFGIIGGMNVPSTHCLFITDEKEFIAVPTLILAVLGAIVFWATFHVLVVSV
jgi:hypothetical protein